MSALEHLRRALRAVRAGPGDPLAWSTALQAAQRAGHRLCVEHPEFATPAGADDGVWFVQAVEPIRYRGHDLWLARLGWATSPAGPVVPWLSSRLPLDRACALDRVDAAPCRQAA